MVGQQGRVGLVAFAPPSQLVAPSPFKSTSLQTPPCVRYQIHDYLGCTHFTIPNQVCVTQDWRPALLDLRSPTSRDMLDDC